MKPRLSLLLFLLCGSFSAVRAQEFLTLDSAVAKALMHNYDVRIADVTTQVAATNNFAGNAGLLPNVGGTAGGSEGISNTRLVRTDGTTTAVSGAGNTSMNAGINATYTVFAGGRAWLIYRQLGRREALADAQLRVQIQATISGVIQAYAAVVNDQRQTVAIDTAIALAKVRMDLSKAKYDVGTSAKVDYLQGRVDYNAAISQRISQQASRASNNAALNELMGEMADAIYVVEDSLQINLALTAADSSLLISRSPLLDAQRINVEIARYDKRIAKTYMLPSLGVNGGYQFNRSTTDAGVLLSNRQIGPAVGVTLNVPIFQGFVLRRAVKVASLNELSAELAYDRQERAISRQYRAAWATYKSAVDIYNLESENRGYAKENLDIQQQRFKVGVATTLELREAEASYVSTLARYYLAAYNAKVAETRVLELEARLNGESGEQ
jgi:outer membrane protein